MKAAVQTPSETVPPATADDKASIRATNLPPPEEVQVTHREVYCDGAGYGDGGAHRDCADIPAALGHPRVYLAIPTGLKFIDCTYCDRRFVLAD